MKKLLSFYALGCIASVASADFVWVGGVSTSWQDGGNWEGKVSPGNNPSAPVIVDGNFQVIYHPGGDFVPMFPVTFSGGVSFTQADSAAWPYFHAPIVFDNATFDSGTMGQFRTDSPMIFRNGSSFVARMLTFGTIKGDAKLVLDSSTMTSDSNGTAANIPLFATNSVVNLPNGVLSVPEITFDGCTAEIKTINVNGPVLVKDTSLTCNNIANASPLVVSGDSSVTTAAGLVATLDMYGGTVSVSGNFTFRDGSTLTGGALTVGNEFHWSSNMEIDGATVVANIFACQRAGTVLSLKSGRIVATSSSYNGMYQGGGSIDIPDGSKGVITFPIDIDKFYSSTFGTSTTTPKFTYMGEYLSQADFEELFVVEESSDYAGSVDVYLKQGEAGQASFSGAQIVLGAVEDGAEISILATFDDPGSPVADVKVIYGATDMGNTLEGWDAVASLGTATAVEPSSIALESDTMYALRLAAENSVGTSFFNPPSTPFYTGSVNISAEAASMPEDGEGVVVTVSRADTDAAKRFSLPVLVSLAGSAIDSTHYTVTPSNVVIPAGEASTTLLVKPIPDWTDSEEREVLISIAASDRYIEAEPAPSVAISIENVSLPGGNTNVWLGVVSDDSRDDRNWSLSHVPTATEVVYVLDSASATDSMHWYPETASTVAGWVQSKEFSNKRFPVYFHTTPEMPLVIDGDVVLGYGNWTHSGPSSEPSTCVNIVVKGDMVIGSDAQVQAGNGTTNDNTGYSRGWSRGGPGFLHGIGGSYAGDGGRTNSVDAVLSYGSILNPMEWGASGYGDNVNYAGGGLVVLDVAGTLTIEGTIRSRGFGYPNIQTGHGAGSGGTVNIKASNIGGNGSIDVNGGSDNLSGAGSGGRIRIAVSGEATGAFADASNVRAIGATGTATWDTAGSAAGTICLSGEQWGSIPKVIVRNSSVRYRDDFIPGTHLPSLGMPAEKLLESNWVLEDYGVLRLTADAKIGNLSLSTNSGNQKILTDGHSLIVHSATIGAEVLRSGEYTSVDFPDVIIGEGSLIVRMSGTIISIY